MENSTQRCLVQKWTGIHTRTQRDVFHHQNEEITFQLISPLFGFSETRAAALGWFARCVNSSEL